MNFLAHLVLAPQTPEGLIGSIAPDMIRGPLPTGLPASVLDAAREHQRIDRFTDAHRAFARTRDRLRLVVDPRLAGVLADVLYDHVLARDWSRWRGDALSDFVARAERSLMEAQMLVPMQMRLVVQKMIDERWLSSYARAQGIRDRLASMSQRITQRLGRPMSLQISEQALADQYPLIAEDFAPLWSDLLAYVQRGRLPAEERVVH